MPYPVMDCLFYHHEPSKSSLQNGETVIAVHVANAIANAGSVVEEQIELDETALEELQLTQRVEAWQSACVSSLQAAS